jgi:uncharacterized protein (DUF952 family)
MDRPVPAYVYKIAVTPPPETLPHTLPLSELDQNDGFIHLSDASQTPITSSQFFSSFSTLHLLRISSVAVKAEGSVFKWVDEGQTGCIHLYGGNGVKGEFGRLGLGTVVDATEWKKDEGRKWDDKEVIDSLSGWLKDSE